MKTILLFLLIAPVVALSQKDSINLRLASLHLKKGSSQQLTGLCVSVGSAAIGGLLISRGGDQKAGFAFMGAGILVGTVFNISGILHYGKAGKRLYDTQ